MCLVDFRNPLPDEWDSSSDWKDAIAPFTACILLNLPGRTVILSLTVTAELIWWTLDITLGTLRYDYSFCRLLLFAFLWMNSRTLLRRWLFCTVLLSSMKLSKLKWLTDDSSIFFIVLGSIKSVFLTTIRECYWRCNCFITYGVVCSFISSAIVLYYWILLRDWSSVCI